MITKIDRYILKQVLAPLMTTLGIAALLLVLERMLRLFDFVVNQGGPVDVVFKMLANLTPHYMGLALPIGMFLGILLAFRKLSISSELDALTSSGISLPRLMRPVLFLATFLMLINVILVGWVQPHSRYAYRGLEFDLRSGALGASIRVGEFVELGDDIVLRIEESQNQGADLVGIFLERRNEQGSISVTAKRGGFYATGDSQTIVLRLFDGVLVDLNESQNKPRVLSFERQDLTVKLPTAQQFRNRGGEEREMTLPELFLQKDNPDIPSSVQASYNGNYHWRVMHSLTFLILPFLAIPLGITNKRAASGMGIFFGVATVIVYNEMMEGMKTAVVSGASPYLSIWLLYGIMALLSFGMFHTTAFKVGGEPLRWLNRAWGAIKSPLIRISRRIIGMAKA